MKLYKYTSAKYALEFLSTHELKVTTLEETNDPDEWVPYRVGPDGCDYLANRSNRDQFRRNVGAQFGFVSLSSRMDNNIMWGHYADKFKGVLLEFEVQPHARLRQVAYHETRYVMGNTISLEDRNVVVDYIARKGTEWSYEAEWRFFVEIAACTAIHLEQGKLVYLFPPEPHLFLSGIVLGPDCRLTFGNVKTALESWRDRDITISRLAHDSQTYALRVAKEHHIADLNNGVVNHVFNATYQHQVTTFTGNE